MRALVLAVCGCQMGGPPPSHDDPPVAPQPIVRGSIAVDDDRACAIGATGKVACWGRANATPVDVPGVDDAAGLAAGPGAVCAWTAHGAVACWGDDPSAKLVPSFGDIIQISIGGDIACGLHATGRVSCWSIGSADVREVAGLAGVVEIAGGYGGGAEQLCARTKAGAITCGNQVSPFAAIPQLAGATSLGGAGARFAALLPAHRLATWVGWTGKPMPQLVDGVDGERVILGGHLNGTAAICVLGAHARCWTWAGEPTLALKEGPSLGAGVRDIALDTEATCDRVGDRVACWGRLGRLGDGETEYPRDLVRVSGITDARQLDTAGRTMCVLRATGRVACWGERLRGDTIDRTPVELEGVTDAVEIAMEGADRGDGQISAAAVCARRARGVTCWTAKHGQLETSEPPELAAAVKLYAGPAVCGVAASGAVRCVRLSDDQGYIPGFSEDDYETYVNRASTGTVPLRIARVLEKRLHGALASHRLAAGFHGAGTSDTIGRTGPAFEPPVDELAGAVELRRMEWAIDWDTAPVRGVLCARHSDGTVACWGERDYLGAGQHSTRDDPVTVRGANGS